MCHCIFTRERNMNTDSATRNYDSNPGFSRLSDLSWASALRQALSGLLSARCHFGGLPCWTLSFDSSSKLLLSIDLNITTSGYTTESHRNYLKDSLFSTKVEPELSSSIPIVAVNIHHQAENINIRFAVTWPQKISILSVKWNPLQDPNSKTLSTLI